jgi:hypothetical protein
MAKPKAEADLVECRVLSNCHYGSWGEVVMVEKSVAMASPFLDLHPDSVAYAKSVLQGSKRVSNAVN